MKLRTFVAASQAGHPIGSSDSGGAFEGYSDSSSFKEHPGDEEGIISSGPGHLPYGPFAESFALVP